MTNDEIMKQLDSLLSRCKSTGYPLITANDCEALGAAIAALRPSGEPLTLEQLREMDGRPVWIVGITQKWLSPRWAIVDRDNCLVRTAINWSPVFFENYGRTWLAYAYLPIDREKWKPCKLCGMLNDEITCRFAKFTAYDQSKTVRYTSAKYCPECGRPLTEAAWEELEKRLRG